MLGEETRIVCNLDTIIDEIVVDDGVVGQHSLLAYHGFTEA